ncbi:hypothetical protein CERZMDRAFT_95360 [Cercospora zeae-maydis SCOH1-5]|uniref:Uncharacterized protein n=1 Tax=Cercospora zeae-maydis SCOH1-5 TaxID=717836 RepID=A0A6A6FNC9_9PEZI|nr:hypothetical protein CERZMDRAFT_95360 [Cercospora zeae-maydis SCOH1-5]
MRSLLATSLALLAASAAANSIVQVNNFCPFSHWITIMNGTFFVEGQQTMELARQIAYQTGINGKGNSLGITTSNNYWTPATPKVVLYYSTDQGQIAWSINSLDGEPFANDHFNVTTATGSGSENFDVCGSAVGYEGKGHSCADTGNVTLNLNLCLGPEWAETETQVE